MYIDFLVLARVNVKYDRIFELVSSLFQRRNRVYKNHTTSRKLSFNTIKKSLFQHPRDNSYSNGRHNPLASALMKLNILIINLYGSKYRTKLEKCETDNEKLSLKKMNTTSAPDWTMRDPVGH